MLQTKKRMLTVCQVAQAAYGGHVGGAMRDAITQQLWRGATLGHHPVVFQHLPGEAMPSVEA